MGRVSSVEENEGAGEMMMMDEVDRRYGKNPSLLDITLIYSH